MRFLVFVALLAGCGERTEIVVRVDVGTTLTPVNGFTSGNITGVLDEVCFDLTGLDFGEPIAAPMPDPAWSPVLTVSKPACAPFQLGIVPRGDWDGKQVGVRVRGMSSCTDTNASFLYALGETRFVGGQVSLLELSFTSACAAENADATLTCPVTSVTTPPAYIAAEPCE